MKNTDLLEIEPKTIQKLIYQTLTRVPDSDALSFYNQTPLKYSQVGEMIQELSALLKKNAINKGDKVAILGDNSPHWGIAYLSIVCMGAIAVPILPEFPAEDIEHILNHSESKLLFATKKQVDKISYDKIKSVRGIIVLDDFTPVDSKFTTVNFTDIVNKTMDKLSVFIHDLGEKAGILTYEPKEGDIAVIIYTSGTTGSSKGVMLSHKNIVENVLALNKFVQMDEKDKFLSVLPLSHAMECTVGFLLPLATGSSIYYTGKRPTPTVLKEACSVVHPTLMVLVPLIMEKIYKKKVQVLLEKNFLTKTITRTPFIRKALFKKAVKNILEFLGGSLRLAAFGGAPLNSDVETFLLAGGFPYVVGYGLTETAPLLTGSRPEEVKKGSCGYAVEKVEIKIVEPDKKTGVGEIFAKGPNVMKGYYKNRELTAECLSEYGWFKTGDRGYLDKNNFLFIKGRSKNMFLGASGENIYPEVIEEKLNAILIVAESLVIENRGDIEALIHFDPDFLEPRLEGKSEADQEKVVKELLEQVRNLANNNLSGFSRIKKCLFHREPFAKTATQKIKRYLYYHPGS